MNDLTTRFLGLGNDRLRRTIELSNGLVTPASKFNTKIPDLKPFFPHGRWTAGKTPRVSKGKIGRLHNASIGEVVFTDTFEFLLILSNLGIQSISMDRRIVTSSLIGAATFFRFGPATRLVSPLQIFAVAIGSHFILFVTILARTLRVRCSRNVDPVM
jgi:hypothetical protein